LSSTGRERSCPVVVIGVGNRFRGDDGAGLEVARRLSDCGVGAQIEVLAHEGEGVGLLDLWDGADAAVLIDCMRSGAPAGTLRRIDMIAQAVPVPLRGSSSHATGVAEAIELARALGRLPRMVIVYGVEGASFETGAELSKGVADAIDPACQAVRREALALLALPPRG
jgi:hydrogenase maturation protease